MCSITSTAHPPVSRSVRMSPVHPPSIGFLIHQRYRGSKNNTKIQPDAPIADVPNVVLNAFFHQVDHWRFAAKTVDLRPARQTRFHVVAIDVVADHLIVIIVMSERMGARTNQ